MKIPLIAAYGYGLRLRVISIHAHGDYKSGPTDISSKSLRFWAAFSKRKESAVKLFASERKQPFHLSDLFVY